MKRKATLLVLISGFLMAPLCAMDSKETPGQNNATHNSAMPDRTALLAALMGDMLAMEDEIASSPELAAVYGEPMPATLRARLEQFRRDNPSDAQTERNILAQYGLNERKKSQDRN